MSLLWYIYGSRIQVSHVQLLQGLTLRIGCILMNLNVITMGVKAIMFVLVLLCEGKLYVIMSCSAEVNASYGGLFK